MNKTIDEIINTYKYEIDLSDIQKTSKGINDIFLPSLRK